MNITKLIEKFRKNKELLGHDPVNFYSSGHCAEFSVALHHYLNLSNIPSKIVALYRTEVEENSNPGDYESKTLSHVIIFVGDESFDINGNNAEDNWINSFPLQTSEGYFNEWDFVNYLPENNFLDRECLLYGIPFSLKSINDDLIIFKDIG